MAIAVLLLLIFGPAVVVWLLRANGGLIFLATAGGAVVAQNFYQVFQKLFQSQLRSIHANTNKQTALVSLILIFLPLLLSIVLTFRSITGNKRWLHVAVALAGGVLLALVTVPLLGYFSSSLSIDYNSQLGSSSLWHALQNAELQAGATAAGTLVSVVLLSSHRRAKKH